MFIYHPVAGKLKCFVNLVEKVINPCNTLFKVCFPKQFRRISHDKV